MVLTVYGSILAGIAFALFLRLSQQIQIKFARFTIYCLLLFAIALICLITFLNDGFAKALSWYLLAYFGFDMMRWMVSELTRRHLPPAQANSFFSYMSAYFESGTLLVILIGRFLAVDSTSNDSLTLIIVFIAIAALLTGFKFIPIKNIEVRYPKSPDNSLNPKKLGISPMIRLLVLITCLFAVIEVSIDYSVGTMLKNSLVDYQQIRLMTENYFFASCLLIIIFGHLMGYLIEQKRLSPLLLLRLNAILITIMSALCLIYQSFYFFVAAEVIRRLSEYSLYNPANHMLLSALPEPLRTTVKSRQNLYFYSFIPISLAAVFSFTSKLSFETEIFIVMILIATSSIAILFFLLPFSRKLNDAMYNLSNFADKSFSVIAVHMLSYLRPKDFETQMVQLLQHEPKKLLRKTIILALGYSNKKDSIQTITNQFLIDKEEIQLAALDALKISKQFRASKFLIDILDSKVSSKTQRVKINAMAVIASMFGKFAIPFLLKGLDEPDPRIVANAIEVLSVFREKELIAYFVKYIDSPTPRIKANALLALSRYSSHKSIYREGLQSMLSSEDFVELSSALYVVGRTKDSHFKDQVLNIFHHDIRINDERLANPLAWALIRIDDPHGYSLIVEIMLSPTSKQEIDIFMHYFSQHDQEVRFEIVKQFVIRHHGDHNAVLNFGKILKDSVFDFHEELEYLNLCFDSYFRKST